LEEVHDKFGDGKHDLFKSLIGVIDLTKESLQQKKTNLLGCKMKIY